MPVGVFSIRTVFAIRSVAVTIGMPIAVCVVVLTQCAISSVGWVGHICGVEERHLGQIFQVVDWSKDMNNSGDKDDPRSVQRIGQVVLRLTLR